MTEAQDFVFFLDPLKIKINKDLPRWRKSVGDIKSLMESIRDNGQIQPIVVNRGLELLIGGRRVAACIAGGMKVKCIYKDTIDPITMRMWELEENVQREDFSPAEYALAIEELHNLKQKVHGVAQSGREGGWRLEDTAKLLGKTKGNVIDHLQMAQAVHCFPELADAKKKSDIKKAVAGLEQLAEAVAAVKKHTAAVESKSDLFQLIKGDSVEHMESMKTGSIDILCTDPLYGIEANKLCQGIGGTAGARKKSISGYSIDDSTEPALFYVSVLAKESFRFCSDKAHGYIFVGPEHFHTVRKMFTDAGWFVHIKPIIWIKRETGQCNAPHAWPSSCYEMLIYVRKDASRLIQQGMPDWIDCDPVLPSLRIHPYEKPVDLLTKLLTRVCLPGQVVYDPFVGSASTLEASYKLQLFSIGVEIDDSAYAMALSRMSKIIGAEDEQKAKKIVGDTK
jgi:ParB/RepB/Spo0J family partition protein